MKKIAFYTCCASDYIDSIDILKNYTNEILFCDSSENSYIDPFGNHQRVGNGGFSLRSKKLLDVPKHEHIEWDVNQRNFYKHMNANNFAEDGNICVHNRHIYERCGCKFASVEVAARFAHEKPTKETEGIIPFGFHYHLPIGTKL